MLTELDRLSAARPDLDALAATYRPDLDHVLDVATTEHATPRWGLRISALGIASAAAIAVVLVSTHQADQQQITSAAAPPARTTTTVLAGMEKAMDQWSNYVLHTSSQETLSPNTTADSQCQDGDEDWFTEQNGTLLMRSINTCRGTVVSEAETQQEGPLNSDGTLPETPMQITQIDDSTKTWWRMQTAQTGGSSNKKLAWAQSPQTLRAAVAGKSYSLIGTETLTGTLAGRSALHLRTTYTGPSSDPSISYTDLWVDPTSYLPLKETDSQAPKTGGPTHVLHTSTYEWLPVTPANLALLQMPIPAGYREVQPGQ